jgi:uncharacterized protein (TIGR02246 family)
MMHLYRVRFTAAIVFAVCLAACSQQPAAPSSADTRKTAEDAIKLTNEEFTKAVGAKDLDKIGSFYTDDAVLFSPSGPAAVGKGAVRAAWGKILAGPPSKIAVNGTVIDVAASGDLAVERGSFTITIPGAKGKTTTATGQLLNVWKKQADGSWKMAADTNASDK